MLADSQISAEKTHKNQENILYTYQHYYQRNYFDALIRANQDYCRGQNFWYWTPSIRAIRETRMSEANGRWAAAFQAQRWANKHQDSSPEQQQRYADALAQRTRYDYQRFRRALKQGGFTRLVLWNGHYPGQRAARKAAEDLGIPCYLFENGLLPNTVTCDPRGINAGNSIPRQPTFYQGYANLPHAPLPEWKLATRPAGSARAAANASVAETPIDTPYLFAPLQVFNDSQLVAYGGPIESMDVFLAWLLEVADRAASQGLKLVVKEHPSCKRDYSAWQGKHPNLVFANSNSTETIIKESSGIITVNSSVGLEALLFNKPVISIGAAYYNISGLTLTARNPAALAEQIADIRQFQPDPVLREGFLQYLVNEYCIAGDWRQPSNSHLLAVGERLRGKPILR